MRNLVTLVAVSVALLIAQRSTAQPQFITLNGFPGQDSFAYGVAPDGSTVVGQSANPQFTGSAYQWTSSGMGSQIPGLLNDGQGVSLGGTYITGRGIINGMQQAYRWSAETGRVGIGALPGHANSYGFGISNDGAFIAGTSNFQAAGSRAFRWGPMGMQNLGVLDGGMTSEAYDISGDGSVVVGVSFTSTGARPFRWTEDEGMAEVITGFNSGFAFGVSNDGLTIVGKTSNLPFIWNQVNGSTILTSLTLGEANAVSGDGSIVVGDGRFEQSGVSYGIIWDAEHGVRRLSEYLTNEVGLDLNGFFIRSAQGISADGRTIVGFGDPAGSGSPRGFIAIVPAPAAFAVIAFLGVVRSRRRR